MSKRTQLLRNMKYKNKEGYSILLGKEECDICIEALEKQIAKKPIVVCVRRSRYKCPTCNEAVQINYDMTYCNECGQKILWEVE